jgi:hypothetical protein
VGLDYTFMKVEGEQDQFTPETGLRVTGVPATITYSAGVFSGYLGYRF